MMAFPSMLLKAAQEAGMKTPPLEDQNTEGFDPTEFPHFHVFCIVQLGRRMELGEHWENAKVVAAIPDEFIHLVTLRQLIARGLAYST